MRCRAVPQWTAEVVRLTFARRRRSPNFSKKNEECVQRHKFREYAQQQKKDLLYC